MVKRCRSFVAPVCALLAFGAEPVDAHPEMSPQTVNRYVTTLAAGENLHVFYLLLFGELPAEDERKQIDRDDDGTISDSERSAAEENWVRDFPSLVGVTVDDRMTKAIARAKIDLGSEDRRGPYPLVVQIETTIPLPRGKRTIRVVPGREPPRLDETEVVLDHSEEWALRSPRDRQLFRGPGQAGENRSVSFVVASISPGGGISPSAWISIAAFGSLGAGALLWAMAIRRRRDAAQRSENG